MTNSNSNSQQPLNNSKLDSRLLVRNPLFVLDPDADVFHLDVNSLGYLQRMRNQIAVEKLGFQVDLDDPNYAIKTLRLMAWFDAKLELLQDLIELHVDNLQATDPSKSY